MVHLRLSRILKEKHIADQTVKPITDPQAILVALPIESLPHLLLGIVFCLQIIKSITAGNQEMFTDVRHMESEESLEHTIVDEGPREEILTKGQSKVFYLALCHRQRR